MATGKSVINRRKQRQQQAPLGLKGKLKAAKITLSAAGKNQNHGNDRWVNTIHMYHDNLLCR